MARSDQDTCDALREAWALEKRARDEPILREALSRAPGFRTLDSQVHVNWVELARAVGKGSAETAVVTIGGTASRLREPCLDAESFVRWLGRSPSFEKTQACTGEALREIMAEVAAPALERTCVCETPEPRVLGKLETALGQLQMDPEPWKAWAASSWTACPAVPVDTDAVKTGLPEDAPTPAP